MKSAFALAAIALVVVAYSLPYTEDSIVVESDPIAALLQTEEYAQSGDGKGTGVAYTSGTGAAAVAAAVAATPVPVPAAGSKDAATMAKESKVIAAANAKAHKDAKALSIAHAESLKKKFQKGAKKAETVEQKWTADEDSFAKKAKELNKAQRKAQREEHDSLAKDKKDLKDYELHVTKKISEANKGTAAAQAEYDALQAKYKKEIQDSHAADRYEAAIAAKRAAADKKEMDDVGKEIKGEVAEGKKAQDKIVKTAKDLDKKKKDIEINYNDTVKELSKTAELARVKLETQQAAAAKAMAQEDKSNSQKAAAAEKAIADEAKKNAKTAADEKKKIDDRYAKERSEKAKAQVLYRNKMMAQAAATSATRESKAKEFQKQADAADLQYKKAMERADSLKDKADHAQAMWKGAMADAATAQANREKASQNQANKDLAMTTCALPPTDDSYGYGGEVSECLDAATNKCVKVTDKGPYLAADLVTCTMTQPKKQQYAGEAWAGIPPPPPLKPLPAPTPTCLAKQKAFAATEYGKIMAAAKAKGECPSVAVACHDVPDSQLMAKKQAFLEYFDMAAACPPWCVPGTATMSDGVADTHGICITGDDVNIFKQQIADLPEWKAMGTNKKIPANFGIMSICKMAQNFLKGFMDGSK